jgi:hypothetical protein
LLFAAAIDNLWWDLRSAWLVGGFWTSLAVLYWLYVVLLSDECATPRRARLFCLVSVPFVVKSVSAVEPSLYYDTPCLLIVCVMVVEMLRWRAPAGDDLAGGNGTAGWLSQERQVRLALIVLLGALAFTCKPLGLVALVGSVLFACGVLGKALFRVRPAMPVVKTVFGVMVLPSLLLCGYFARNVVLSGWLLYPAPVGKCPVEWAMPEEPMGQRHAEVMQSVAGQCRTIQAWARWGGADGYVRSLQEGHGPWWPVWLANNRGVFELRLFPLGAAAFVVAFVAYAVRRRFRELARAALWMAFGLGNLAFWFLGAPDIRFGDGFFWIGMGFGVSAALDAVPVKAWNRYALAAALAMSFMAVAVKVPRLRPQPRYWVTGKAWANATDEVVLKNGQTPPLVVRVPRRGDQCGDAPLPCTPYPRDRLLWRQPGNLAAGFKVQEAPNR